MTRSRRPRAGTVLLVVFVAAALFAASRVSRVLFEGPVHPRLGGAGGAAAPAAADEGGIFQVAAAEGQVDAFRDGRWIAIQRGDLLTRDDIVRTVPGARAVLSLSAGAEIELREKVEIRLDRLSAAGASLDLRRGKVVARVASAADALAITARETRTSNDGPAHFVVLADEHGQVSVAALKGQARFAAGGKSVTLPAGTETRSRQGAPPDDPEKIAEEVLLQVVWPAGERHEDSAAVEGRVRATSLVTVNGEPATVKVDGRFAVTVPLREGANVVEVKAEDLAGRMRAASATLTRRPVRPPKLAPVPGALWSSGDGGTP